MSKHSKTNGNNSNKEQFGSVVFAISGVPVRCYFKIQKIYCPF